MPQQKQQRSGFGLQGDTSHRGFEEAAIDAARRIRFRPRVVNGEAALTEGVSDRREIRAPGRKRESFVL